MAPKEAIMAARTPKRATLVKKGQPSVALTKALRTSAVQIRRGEVSSLAALRTIYKGR